MSRNKKAKVDLAATLNPKAAKRRRAPKPVEEEVEVPPVDAEGAAEAALEAAESVVAEAQNKPVEPFGKPVTRAEMERKRLEEKEAKRRALEGGTEPVDKDFHKRRAGEGLVSSQLSEEQKVREARTMAITTEEREAIAEAQERAEKWQHEYAAKSREAGEAQPVDYRELDSYLRLSTDVLHSDNVQMILLLKNISEKLSLLIANTDPVRITRKVIEAQSVESIPAPTRESAHPEENEPQPSIVTPNGVTIGSEVYIAYLPKDEEAEEARTYAGHVTAITSESVTVHVEEDNSEDEYEYEHVFPRTEEGHRGAQEVVDRESLGALRKRANRSEALLSILTDDDVETGIAEVGNHHHLMSALALLGITNFNLEGKGEERKAEIVKRVEEFREDKEAVTRLVMEANKILVQWKKRQKTLSEATPQSAQPASKEKPAAKKKTAQTSTSGVPNEPEIGDWVIYDKQWYPISEIKRGVFYGRGQRDGVMREFHDVEFYKRTKSKNTPVWNALVTK